jgi:hypothetical protein
VVEPLGLLARERHDLLGTWSKFIHDRISDARASCLTSLKVDPGISTSTFNIKTRRNRILQLIINRSLHGEFSPQGSEVNYLPKGTSVVSPSLPNNVVSRMCWLWRLAL